MLSWLLTKFGRGAPRPTAAEPAPTVATNVVSYATIEDNVWYVIPRSTAVNRIRFVPSAHNPAFGVVTVVYKKNPQQYDSVPNVPRDDFYALAFAESVGRYLELLFWPLYSQNVGKHRAGMPGQTTIKRGGRGRWHAVPPNRGNTGHRKVK